MLAYCPERILPGNTLRELTDNERLVGGLDRRSADRAYALGIPSSSPKGPFNEPTPRPPKMVKLTENAFHDVNIAFANELSLIFGEAPGIDVWQVIHLANLHPRVNILSFQAPASADTALRSIPGSSSISSPISRP